MFCGDWHGSIACIRTIERTITEHNIDTIVHVGDFGYYPHSKPHQRFLYALVRELDRLGVRLYFVDGNHEDHISLGNLARTDEGIARVAGPIWHLGRGVRWEWCGVRFGALGGAGNVVGTPEPGEAIREHDIEVLGTPSLNVLVSHEAPAGTDLVGAPEEQLDAYSLAEAKKGQDRMLRAVVQTTPQLLIHGHWHQRRSQTTTLAGHTLRIESLDKGPDPATSHLLVDLSDLRS